MSPYRQAEQWIDTALDPKSTRLEILAAESNLRRLLRSADPDPALFAIEPVITLTKLFHPRVYAARKFAVAKP